MILNSMVEYTSCSLTDEVTEEFRVQAFGSETSHDGGEMISSAFKIDLI